MAPHSVNAWRGQQTAPARSSAARTAAALMPTLIRRMTPSMPATPGNGTARYTVRSGDTLQSIAATLFGDASLWYIIGEANGLTSSSALSAGQSLTIPGKIANFHSEHRHMPGAYVRRAAADTFRPYDASKAIGDTQPTTPRPPKKAAGCGVFGQILLAAVAIAVTAIIAPAGAPLLTQIGAAVAGSVVSQGVGLATGIQDKFSFKGVALAAITAGVGQGLDKLGILVGSSTAAVAGQAALANTITQGVAVATGLQKRFDFAGVAVAGIVAGTISAVSRNLPGAGVAATKTSAAVRPTILNQTLSGTAALIAGAGARSIVTGTSFGDNITAALPDAIGATIGNAVAGRLARSETARGADDKRPGANQGDFGGDFAPGQKGIQLASSDGSIGDVTFADIKAAGQAAFDNLAQGASALQAYARAKLAGASFDAAVEAATEVAAQFKNTITVTATRLSDSIASVAVPYLSNIANAITGGLNRAGEVQFRADRAEAAGNRAVLRAVGQGYQQLDNRYQVTTRGLGFIQVVGGLVGAVGSAAAVGSGVALEVPSVGTSTALVVAGGIGFTASIDAARAGFATAVRGQYQPTFVEGSAIALGASPSQAALTSAALQIGGGAAAARVALTAQNVSAVSLRNIGSVEGGGGRFATEAQVVAGIERNADIAVELTRRQATRGLVKSGDQAFGSRSHLLFDKLNQRLDRELVGSGSDFRLQSELFRNSNGVTIGRNAPGSIGADAFLTSRGIDPFYARVFDLKTYGSTQIQIPSARQNLFQNRFGAQAQEIYVPR